MTAAIRKFAGAHRFLSNFYPCEIEWEFLIYPSVEHAYQASKTTTMAERHRFTDDLMTPGRAKAMGKVIGIREDWEQVKIPIMRELCRIKFSQEPLRSLLRETHPYHLEEGNMWGDVFWGTFRGEGENHLGKILMEVRQEIVDA